MATTFLTSLMDVKCEVVHSKNAEAQMSEARSSNTARKLTS